MRLQSYWQQALLNVWAQKLRSFLAVLGILMGTAAVVALISSGQLATEKALQQFKMLGTDLLAVTLFQKATNNMRDASEQISLDFWREIPHFVPDVVKIAPYSTGYQPMSFQGKPVSGVVIGADESLARIVHIDLLKGHFVSFVESFEHYCVIGDGIYQRIKSVSMENPIGQQLQIGKALYTIIGVAKPWRENAFFNEDINGAVIIPISGMMLVNKDAKINNAVLLLKPEVQINAVIEQLKAHLSKQAPKLNIFIRSAKQIIASMESQGRIFTLLLAVIGGISLLVGGIGIMNVMLVSVGERKKEIGIRKACGAMPRDIRRLFLVESLMLSLLGGLLGVVIGLIFTAIVAYFSHWVFRFHLMPPMAGFGVSVITGIFFGYYPASCAAALDPIVAMRSD